MDGEVYSLVEVKDADGARVRFRNEKSCSMTMRMEVLCLCSGKERCIGLNILGG